MHLCALTHHARRARTFTVGLAALALAVGSFAARLPAQAPRAVPDSAFAALVATLSEPGGYFDTDNLITNEDSYLIPLSVLRTRGLAGSAYIGVGPDQNFSYIAELRPRVAFVLDIRRDNMLEHLMFKALFARARSRVEYLALLFGRPLPSDSSWNAKPIDSLVAWAAAARGDSASRSAARAVVTAELGRWPGLVSANDRATIARFHEAFMQAGPALRFNTFGRAPQPYHPDLARLLTERDAEGRSASYLASEVRFRAVKDLHARNLIIPVTGDFAGAKALVAIADWLRRANERVGVFYTSNVEQYLGSGLARFAASVAALPQDERAVFIRSCFVCRAHPAAVPGYHAVPLVQPMSDLAAAGRGGQAPTYGAIIAMPVVPVLPPARGARP